MPQLATHPAARTHAFRHTQVLLRHEPIEGTTQRRFYQPQGMSRLGFVDVPPDSPPEPQYFAPERPKDSPSVQVRAGQPQCAVWR